MSNTNDAAANERRALAAGTTANATCNYGGMSTPPASETAPRESIRVAGSGLTLAADVYGDDDAPTVMLMHGGGQTRHAWGGAGAAFANAGYRAVSVDLRGHSDSDWSPDGDYALQRYADDLIAVARTCSSPPALVGASLGGLAAMLALATVTRAAGSPLASCLVLVDVAPRIETAGRVKIQEFMRAGMRGFDSLDEAADAVALYNPHRPRPKDPSGLRKNLRQRGDGRWYWHWDPRFVSERNEAEEQSTSIVRTELSDAASLIDIPTMLVRGRMSDIVSDESVSELKQLVPHAEIADVAEAGHMVAGDRNDIFNAAVIDFVQRVMPAERS